MTYDNTNSGVAFTSSGFTGKINLNGIDYRLAIVGADDKMKFKFTVFIYNREECYQTVLFNKDSKNEKAPNYGGQIKLDNGEDYWLAVWHRKSEKGSYFMSFKATEKDNQPVMDSTSFNSMPNTGIDDEIPF